MFSFGSNGNGKFNFAPPTFGNAAAAAVDPSMPISTDILIYDAPQTIKIEIDPSSITYMNNKSKQTSNKNICRDNSNSSSTNTATKNDDDNLCSICLEDLSGSNSSGKIVMVKKCSHKFHHKCLVDCFQRNTLCPLCRADIPAATTSQGKGPSGTFDVEVIPKRPCPGFHQQGINSQVGCIRLKYDIPAGTQLQYHPNPGQGYDGTQRVAYLPNCNDGKKLLVRFQYAFTRGFTFDIGTSGTSGITNAVVWNTKFGHKTSLHGGPFGFPDPFYISNAHKDFDDLSIPDASICWNSMFITSTAAAPTAATGAMITNASNPTAGFNNNNNTIQNTLYPLTASVPVLPAAAASILSNLNNSDYTVSKEMVQYKAPKTLSSVKVSDIVIPILDRKNYKNINCTICFGPLIPKHQYQSCESVEIKGCSHAFHRSCIETCFQHESKCPICRKQLGEPQGKCPSATMTIEPISTTCPGFYRNKYMLGYRKTRCTTIRITYTIPNGTQQSYHDNPGVWYTGTCRTAYLPDSYDGRLLLLRLKYAFLHGLTFAVGTSLTTGANNVTTWTSIHHKTNVHGGAHGFPDEHFIDNCNQELDTVGVPKSTT